MAMFRIGPLMQYIYLNLKRFARVCSHIHCFNSHIKCLTAYLLHHKLRKAFSLLYRRHHELVSKFVVRLKSLFHQGLSELEFNGDLAKAVVLMWFSVACCDVRVLVMFHLIIILLVRSWLLSDHLLGNSCPLSWSLVLIVFCLFAFCF